MEAVHGVTIEEVHMALQRSDWNPVHAEQQLKVRLRNDSTSIKEFKRSPKQHESHVKLQYVRSEARNRGRHITRGTANCC